MALKTVAYLLTGSVGLLSDAAESLVNLIAAVMALAMLTFAARPADAGHPYGHGKAEYFASGFEGLLILVAAAGIAWAAWQRLWFPQPLAALDMGIALSALSAGLNGAVAWVLLRAGRKYRSITLEADGKHLLSDVWTTVAILAALGGIALTGWQLLDPLIAMVAALHIVWAGISLLWRSVAGLLDAALPDEDTQRIRQILDHYREQGIEFHDLRTRAAGSQRFMTVHVLVPGAFTVREAHDLVERIEADIHDALGQMAIVTHLEPVEDDASFAHERLEPEPNPPQRVPGRTRRVVGGLLLVGGGGASMLLPDIYADMAMGVSLLGLILSLSGDRANKAA